jgi:Acetyltransferase (GNAT) family
MNKNIIKPIPRNDFTTLYEYFMSHNNDTLLHNLGFIPNATELKYHFFDDPDITPELLLGSYINNQFNGFIHAIQRPWKTGDSSISYIKWLQINPTSPNRQTTGQLLLNAIEERLVTLGCKQLQFGSASPYYLIPGIPVEDNFTRTLLTENGWQESSERISLRVNPSQCDNCRLFSQLQTENETYSLSSLTAPDSKLHDFISKYFSPSWAMEVEFGLTNIPMAHCSVLKNSSGNIIGFAAVNAVNRNWFGPMGILTGLRGRGLGKLILCHVMQIAEKTGTTSLILSWVNDKADFYRKFFPDAEDILFKKAIKLLS